MARSLLTWVIGRKRSFGYALKGLSTLYRETNARIHAVLVFVPHLASRFGFST